DSDSIRAPGGQGPSLNTPHARDAVPKVWTLRLRSEMGRHRLLTASGDIPAHWLMPASSPPSAAEGSALPARVSLLGLQVKLAGYAGRCWNSLRPQQRLTL